MKKSRLLGAVCAYLKDKKITFLSRSTIGAIVLAFLPASQSNATIIGPGDFSGSETLIDFTGINIPLTPSPITVGDLTMDSSVSDLVIGPDIFGVWPETPQASGGDYLSNWITNETNMEFQFANPVNRVGMWINGGNTATNWTFTAYDAGNALVGSHVFNFNLVDGFPDPSTFAGIGFLFPQPSGYSALAC